MGIYPLVASEYWLTEEELVDIAANDEDEMRVVVVIGHNAEQEKRKPQIIPFSNQASD